MKRFANMVGIMDGLRTAYPGAAWQFVTLTAKNCSVDALPATVDEMCRAWNSIASRKTFKAKIAGWARSLEITYNETSKEVHPHFHMLVMWHEGMKPDEDYLTEAWMDCTTLTTSRLAQNSQIVRAKAESEAGDLIEAVLETYKYTVKSSDLETMPIARFKKVAEAIKGRRLVAFGGKVKQYAKITELDDMETFEDEGQETKCVKCGSTAVRDVCAEWAGTGYTWLRR